MFILSSNILALIFPTWRTRLLPSHIVFCKTPPPHPPLLYLPFAFRPNVLHLACCHFVQGILFGCTDYMPSPPTSKPFSVTLFHSQSQSHLSVICSYSHLQPSARFNKKFLYVSFPLNLCGLIYPDNWNVFTRTQIEAGSGH